MSRHEHDTDFDRHARSLHAQALRQLTPPVRRRLGEARHAVATAAPARKPPGHRGWLLAGAGIAAMAALALALQLRPAAPGAAAPGPALATAPQPDEAAGRRTELDRELEDMLVALDENPDLYLWLAANDDALPPPSEY